MNLNYMGKECDDRVHYVVEELKQPRKHPILEKVEIIKDTLKYFGII